MASGLHDKINSYTLEKGIEFDVAYSTNPTQTGSLSAVAFSLTGTAPVRVWDAPYNGGDTCWSFSWTTSSTTNTYFNNSSISHRNIFTDGDYSVGFWFKVPTIPSDNSFYRLFELGQTGGICGFVMDIMGTTNANGPFTGPKIRVGTGAVSLTDTINYSTTPLVANIWYYFALTKTGTTTSTYTAYLNGTQFATWQQSGTAGSCTRITFGRNGAHTQSGTFKIANYYSGTSSNINATAIQEIWQSGDFGYRKGLANLGSFPTIHYDFNDSSGIDVVYNVATVGVNDLNLSANPTWTAYPNGKSRGAINLSSYSAYDLGAGASYGQSNSIMFWFKRSSAPASQLAWSILNYSSTLQWNSAAHAGINTNGTITFAPRLSTVQPALTSTTNICDGNWHHVVITRGNGGVEAKMYIDGSLESSQTWVNSVIPYTSNFYPFAGLGNEFDEYQYFDSTTLTAQQISDLYGSTISATNLSYPATPMSTLDPHAEFPMPAYSAESSVSVTYNSEAFGGEFNTADFVLPLLSTDTNLDAFGVAEASADAVLPIITSESNLEYAASFMEATATQTLPIISTEIYVDVAASPMTASALLSSNLYFGQTVQDTSYNLNLREISFIANVNAHNGFILGTQNDGATVTNKQSLLLQNANGVPALGTVIKAKFDSTQVTAIATGNTGPNNTFNVYVFTENPSGGATWNDITYSNLPAKELIHTTRLADDGLNPNYYLDITPAAQDSRAYTYGIFIEHVQDTFTGLSNYDRVEYSGAGLDIKLMYLLTSDFVNKNINADIMTATAEQTLPTVYVERFVDFQDGVAEATADIVHPVISAETSNEYTSGTLDASAEAIQPTFSATVEYTSGHLEADARMGLNDPVIYVEGTVTLSADPMTADALFHDPQFNIGENNEVDHMDASALFVDPTLIINESVDAMVTTASVEMVDPTTSGELLGTIAAAPMTASAFSPLPPAYIDLTQDEWFNRLYALDAQSSIIDTLGQHIGVLKFFTESTNITTSTVVAGNGYDEGVGVAGLSAISYLNSVTTPTPLGIVGEFDPYERKAVNLRNISLAWQNIQTGSSDVRSSTDRGFTTELLMKTTKANQILFYGTRASSTTTSFAHSFIGLNNGKIYIKTPSTAALTISATTVVNTTPIIETSKNVADGQWHHILIQNGYDNRTQIWIDGNLEIQRYGYFYPRPLAIGYNSDNANLSSDFLVSGFSSNAGQFILERDIDLNYYAAIKYQPIFAEPMTASVVSGNHKADGNRRRALMLYWWEASARNEFARVSDNGRYGVYDYETFDNALDTNVETQQYYGWDVFSVNVQGDIRSNIVKPEAYGTGIGGFRDPITDNRRYIDIMNDLDLSQFDAIFFRNYPDQTPELDTNTRNEAVDPLLGIIENDIYEKFLEDLRKAVDTGISLYVTNTQLAVDLGIVDRVEEFRDLQESNGGAYAQQLTGINYGTSGRQGYKDTYTPASFMKVINTIPGLTDHPTYIWQDAAFWENDDAIDFGGADRPFEKFDYRENGLIVGDIIKVSDTNEYYQPRTYLQAVPLANVKAGKAITTYASTYKNGSTETPNPYANYALHIAVEPGDILKGTQCGGKIFVNFTEKFPGAFANLASPTYGYEAKEFGQVDLVTDYWINKAYEMGRIDLNTRNTYLNASYNLNRQLEAAELSGNAELIEQLGKKIYWSFHPDYILSQRNANVSNIVVQSGSVGSESVSNRTQNVVNPQTGQAVSWRQEVFFTFKYSRQYPTMTIEIPSMAIRGFWWLAERVVPVGLVERPVAGTASATMQMPQVSADKEIAYNAQAMVALANSVFPTNYTSNDVSVGSLPFAAQATMVNLTTRIDAAPMTASALNIEPGILTSSTDEIVLYLHHVDPILYLREEIIK